jgi:hypothetical protein
VNPHKSAGTRALAELLLEEFKTRSTAKAELPMLTDWGVEDFSERIHSLGINYLSLVGRRAGRLAASEYPFRLRNSAAPGGQGSAWVIPDVVWWDPRTREVELIGEFERYEPGGAKRQILHEKIRNLLLVHQELGAGPRVLLLLLWTVSGIPVQDFEEFRSLIRNGFRMPGGSNVVGLETESRFVAAIAVFTAFEGRLRLKEILL